jgi:tyrosine-protein kinase Etk/Wzc
MIPEMNTSNGHGLNQQSNTHEIKNILTKLFRNWYWFVITAFFALALAFLYIKYTPPLYEINTAILVNVGSVSTPYSAIYGQGGGMFQDTRDWASLYNQIAVASSSPMVSRTISGLDFEISYYKQGRFSETELYNNLPFQVIWDKTHPQIIDHHYNLIIHPDNKISISLEGENVNVHSYRDGETIQTIPHFNFEKQIESGSKIDSEHFSFIIVLNEHPNNHSGSYRIRFNSHNSLVSQYKANLIVTLAEDFSSVLNLSVKDYNIEKGKMFLNRLSQVYLDNNLENKNQTAERTIQFIDSQLESISDSLNISEGRLERFRSSNQVIDFSAQSQQLLAQLNQLDNQIIQHKNQNKYYTYLREYIENNKDMESVIAPSSIGIEDPLLNSFIIQLNTLINQKSSQTSIRPNSEHPTFVQLNTQIEIVKNSLRQSINNILRQSDIELENLNLRMREYDAQIRRLPATERNFVNFERKYRIDSETYTFLLQKLSEARIAKASSMPDGQTLEGPFVKALVSPQRNRIFSIALLLGLIFPASVILIRDLFNDKINSQEDITAITRFPVIGHVLHMEKKLGSLTPVLDKPNSPLGNSYVSIRTKINLLTKGKEHPIVAVTSSLPNEGKSYTAINLASSVALTRKNVVLLDLDLRNSGIAETFELKQPKGVVNYIIGKASIKEIICDTKLSWLKVIPAGPIPPNPAEMLSDKKIKELLEKLKETYDMVIIDTPPIGFVSDMFQLEEMIDANLFVVRHKYTPKHTFKIILEEVAGRSMKGIGIIINNIKQKKGSHGYGYGYGYGNGYGYGYGNGKHPNGKRELLTIEEVTEQRAEGREQRAESKGQRAESTGQRAGNG